jgi:glycerol-3-phosphate dehydrogenase
LLSRDAIGSRIRSHHGEWDIVVVGGGATGVGVAIDAASRGYDVLLLEQSDFGKGTSSRSTKLVHGGVRYLEQGNVSLVMEALRERGLLLRNAPHLVRNLGFVVPRYDWWEAPFYGIGLKVYDLLAGKYGFGASQILSLEETIAYIPTVELEGLRGGVLYYDGQFDDARLLIDMVATAFEQGATLLNYAAVEVVTNDGVVAVDAETGEEYRAAAKVVVNATGAFSDNLRRQTDPASAPMIAPSQGVHLVFDGSFLPGETAIMVPHTSDGRVMFAIPWHGHTLVGTTDTPVAQATLEPVAMDQEVDFLLSTASRYLAKKPTRADVLSVWAGIRPLVRAGDGANTAALSRDHVVHIDKSGLVTVCGGKWTTYRKMAEACVNQAATLAHLEERACVTENLAIHPSKDPGLEMARTVEDVLARRKRTLFLNAREAIKMAPAVAEMMARELGFGEDWKARQLAEFQAVAANYLLH